MALEVLALVDLHWPGNRPLELPSLAGIDLLLLGGDLTHFKGRGVAEEILRPLCEQIEVLAVCGNCDFPEVEDLMEDLGVAIDRRARVVEGTTFLGLSGGLPFGGCPYERTEEEIEEALEQAFTDQGTEASGPTVLLSHQPPRDTLCDLARGHHVGSEAVRGAIERHQPDLVVCGHIHEGVGLDTIGRSRVVNPGPWFDGGLLRFRVDGSEVRILDNELTDTGRASRT